MVGDGEPYWSGGENIKEGGDDIVGELWVVRWVGSILHRREGDQVDVEHNGGHGSWVRQVVSILEGP